MSVFSVYIPIGITSSAIGLKLCPATAEIKKKKSIIKKRKKTHDEMVLLAEYKLTSIDLSHDGFVLVNNVLKEYDNTKEEIKNLKISIVPQIL